MNQDNRMEKIALLILAALALGGLIWIALVAIRAGTIDPNASALIGVIVTGLIAFGKDIISAIRAYAMSAQLGKVTDQLAASAPTSLDGEPAKVEVTNTTDNPVKTEDTSK